MPNISFTGIHESGFEPVETIATLEEGSDALVSLALLVGAFPDLDKRAGRLAVLVPGETPFKDLQPFIDRLAVVAIQFPTFADGRGFSLAVRLRKDLGFKGEIRAIGDILPDQAQYLVRSGFDSADVVQDRLAAFERAHKRYRHFYQTTVNGDLSTAQERHKKAGTVAAA